MSIEEVNRRTPFKRRQLTTKRVALITGITDQDGSYLAEILSQKG
jgi:hypothetical protein